VVGLQMRCCAASITEEWTSRQQARQHVGRRQWAQRTRAPDALHKLLKLTYARHYAGTGVLSHSHRERRRAGACSRPEQGRARTILTSPHAARTEHAQ